jgi:hypothetical protein
MQSNSITRQPLFGTTVLVVVACFMTLPLWGQTVIFTNPGTTYTNTDAVTTDTYSGISIGDCSSIVFSLEYDFSLPWTGSGNMESSDECPFGIPPCAGDPAMPTAGGCTGCWDFLYVRYQVDGVTVFTRLIGVPGALTQSGTIVSPPICVSANSTASIIVQTQTWASDESITFENITVTCWDAGANLTANPNPVCQGAPISLGATLDSPAAIASTNWSGPGTIVSPTNLNTTVNNAPQGNNTYTLTTTDDNACTNTSTVSVTVNPASTVTDPADQTLCAGDPLSVIFAGTASSYTWTNTNTATGIPASGSGDISIPALTNSTAANITSTITVTPAAPCAGPAQTFTITVRPRPTMTQPANVTVCGGQTATVNFSGAGAGATYAWTSDNPDTGIPAAGSGSVFSQVTLPVAAVEVTTITVTPTSSLGCVGVPRTFQVTVNPPLTVDDPANVSLCNGESLDVDFMGTAGNFNWTNNNTASGIPSSGSGDINGINVVNSTANPIVSTITVTPAGSCPGPSQTFTVTVTPGPSMNVPANISVCGSNPVSNAFSGAPAGTIYNWVSSNPAVISPASGSSSSTFSANAIAGTILQVVTVTVTPSLNGCDGPPVDFTVSVSPASSVNDPADVSVCSGAPLTVNFTGTASGYTWTNNNTTTGIPLSGSGNINIPAVTNATGAPIVSTITVSPTSAGCPGPSQTFTVTVGVPPTMNQPANITVCAGTTASTPFTGAPAGTTFSWVSSNPATGIAATGSGANFSSNTSSGISAVQVSTITVTPTRGGCPGPTVSFTVTVDPPPTVAPIAAQSVCAGAAVSIPFSAPPASLVTWTNSNFSAVGGPNVGTANPIAFTASNVAVPTTSTFSLTATQGACTGQATTFVLTVNPPTPIVVPGPVTVCAGQQVTANLPPNVTWTNTNPAIGLPASGSGPISYVAPSPATAQSGTINVTLTNANNCISTGSFVITVQPAPTFTIGSVVCAASLTTYGVALTTNANDVTASTGTVNGSTPNFNVAAITAGTNVTITATFLPSGCSTSQSVNAPNCNCPNVPAATGANNPSICVGAPTPALSVNPQLGLVADWYAASSGGMALASNTLAYIPTGPFAAGTYTFYVEMRDVGTNCVSATRTPVTLTVNAIPTVNDPADINQCVGQAVAINWTGTAGAQFDWTNTNAAIGLAATGTGNIAFTPSAGGTATITVTPTLLGCPGAPQTVNLTIVAAPTLTTGTSVCAPDLLTYTAAIISSAASITSTVGTVSGTSPNFNVTGIPVGNNIVVTATAGNNCTNTITVNAPNCTCAPVPAPTNPNNPSVCDGLPIPPLTVSVAAGMTANWYAAATGGTPLQTGNTSFTPTGSFGPGTYIFYAEEVDPATNCVSNIRTPVTLTVRMVPTVVDPTDAVACADQNIQIVVSGTLGATFNWTSNNTAVGMAASGTGNITANVPLNLSTPQIALVTITPTLNNCTGAPVQVQLRAEPLPTLSTGFVSCAPGGLTYGAEIFTNAPTITTTAGTISGISPNFAIVGIPAGTDITVQAVTPDQCISTLNISSPNCNCPQIPPAVRTGVPNICIGDPIPTLSVTVQPGLTANWYTGPQASILLLENSLTYTPSGPLSLGVNNFFAVAIDTITGCTSQLTKVVPIIVNPIPTVNDPVDVTRCVGQPIQVNFTGTPNNATYNWTNSNPAIGLPASDSLNISFTPTAAGVANMTVTATAAGCTSPPQNFTITVNPIPTLGAGLAICAANLQTYSVAITSSAAAITATAGTVSGTSPNFNVQGIPAGTNITVTATGAGNCTATLNITAPNCNCPVVPAPGNPSNITVCADAALPTLSVTVPAGLQANWYTTPTGGTILVPNAASYTLPVMPPPGAYSFFVETVDPVNNCVSATRALVRLTVNATPTVADPADLTRCSGQPVAITFTGTAGAAFTWTNSNAGIGVPASGSGNINFNANTTGVANFTVTPSLAGCTGPAQTFSVTVAATPTAAIAGDLSICTNQSTTLTASGGTTYSWAAGPNTAAFTVAPIQTRTYTVTVTNAGVCTATATAVVVVNQSYNVTINQITCDPALVGSATQPLQSVQGCDSIVTTITAIDLVACAPEFITQNTNVLCFGDDDASIVLTVQDGFAPFTYTWANAAGQNGSGNVANNNIPATINNLGAGTYTVTVTSINGASSTRTVTITSPAELTTSVVLAAVYNGFGVSCANSNDGAVNSATTGGVPPYLYDWDNGQTNANLTNLGAGTYSVTVTDDNGCTTTDGIELTAPEPVAFDFNALPVRCGDTELAGTVEPLGQNGPYEVALDGVSNGENLRLRIPAGQHVITVTDANGCTAGEVVDVVLFPEIIVALPPDTVITMGTELQLVAQTNVPTWTNITWSPVVDTTNQNTLQQIWTPAESGLISVEITDDNGCRGSATFRYTIKLGNIYVPNALSPFADDSGNQVWRIFADNSVEALESVHIYDRWGSAVYIWEDDVPLESWPGWDGRVDDRSANPAVFVYYAWIRLINGERVLLKGDINLIK